MKNGAFVISLDFELYWGIGDHIDYDNYKMYFDNTLKIIPEMLNLFSKYQIHCTWATVGMLWNENWEEWKKNLPLILPEYQREVLSNYQLDKRITIQNVDQNHFFGLDLINKINKTEGQEIGTHTYSHYYCNEENRNIDALDADLRKAREIAEKTQNKLESLVLPRNQFVESTLQTLKENGIKSVRTNPNVWFWHLANQNNKSSRIARLVDSYSSFLMFKSYPWLHLEMKQGVLLQPASRFLRPISKRFPFLNNLRINRIKKEMTFAAENNEIYHLWWHPHNFALEPKSALEELEEILKHYKYLYNKFKFKSLSMNDVYQEYKKDG
ncbi:MAG: polysaccharide deacetylase [Pusillimonas sp.]|jgi:peptidoglycan/xylan/chitin deacetylase (PgdA/CDA1 family)|nr:polysaccharide deacetylase [Pusillimonas sp.]|tara:strand:- start:40099 stop:41076 length:978 start_codon:yes stop_codon:yes gene_type:complete